MNYDGALALHRARKASRAICSVQLPESDSSRGPDALTRRRRGASGILVTDIPSGPIRRAKNGWQQSTTSSGSSRRRLRAKNGRDRPGTAADSFILSAGSRDRCPGNHRDLAADTISVFDPRPSCRFVSVGISTPEQARSVGELADGVVVGSVGERPSVALRMS
jgi:hypothetical protein